MTSTPMLDKMNEVRDQAAICSEFLNFIQERYTLFAKSNNTEIHIGAGTYINAEHLLAQFFGIDLDQAEREKTELLRSLRA